MEPRSSGNAKEAAVIDAVLQIVADRGLDQVSVREVAAAAGVSIGTVQHYFPTKDLMLAAGYQQVVDRIRSRVQAQPLGPDVRANLTAVLAQLLPQDRLRVGEIRVHLAFAARAATMPALAGIQRAALAELHRGVSQAFAAAWGPSAPAAECDRAAHAAIAVADGLALHAVSSGGRLARPAQLSTLESAIGALLAARQPG